MMEEQDIELIELYIQNKLDDAERERVRIRLEMESDFQALFKDVEILLQGVKIASRMELAGELKRLEDKLSAEENDTVPFYKKYWWIGVAASITFLVVLVMLWTRSTHSPNELLFASYYKPYPNVIVPSVRGKNDETPLATALRQYEHENYAAAIDELNKIEQKDYRVYFYLGNAYLATRDGDNAILNLKQCLKTENALNSQAEWYLALSYLLKNERVQCTILLEKIIAKNGSYAQDASEILTNLQHEK